MPKEFSIKTDKRRELVDITSEVRRIVKEGGVENGMALVFTPHSTAGILVTENEPGLKQDVVKVLKDLVSGFDFLHDRIDNNADSHILSAIIGQGRTLIVRKGEPVLGTWQQIFLVELDGPRRRKVMVQTVSQKEEGEKHEK